MLRPIIRLSICLASTAPAIASAQSASGTTTTSTGATTPTTNPASPATPPTATTPTTATDADGSTTQPDGTPDATPTPNDEGEGNLLSHINEEDTKIGGAPDTTQTFGKELRFFGIETNWSGYGDLVFSALLRDKEATFDASHFNPVFSVRMTDTLSGELELEFEHGGAEINVEYAMVDWAPFGGREFVVRAGKFLAPIGRYNEQLHPSFRWPQIERPLMMNEVIPVEWSDVGVQLRGQLRNGGLAFDYAAFVVNGLGEHPGAAGETEDEEAGEGGFIRGLRSSLTDSNWDKGIGGRAAVTSSSGIENAVSLGVSGYTGRVSPRGDEAGPERLTIVDVDLYARQGPLSLNAEYAQTLFGSKMYGYFQRFERGAYLQLALSAGKLTFAARYDYATFGTQMEGLVGELEDFHQGVMTIKYAPARSWSVRAELVQPFAPSDETYKTEILTGLVFVF